MEYTPPEATPSLSSILATLSSYAAQPQALNDSSAYQAPQPASLYQIPQPAPQELAPSNPILPLSTYNQRASPSPQSTQSSAATIITWPSALRHMLSLAPNQEIMHRIRHLIQEQHSHERQWWRGREELVKKQKGRIEARGKLDGVLKGLGGNITTSNHISDPKADARELERYDQKVHIACGEMIAATERELRSLGVPFFATKEDLIRRKGTIYEGKERGDGSGDGKIDEEEFQGLRRRMVDMLEDLCKE